MDWVEVRRRYYYVIWTVLDSILYSILAYLVFFLVGTAFEYSYPWDLNKLLSALLVFSAAGLVGGLFFATPAYIIGVFASAALIRRQVKSYAVWILVSFIVGCLAYIWIYQLLLFMFPAFILTGFIMCRYAREYYSKNLE